MGKNEYWDKIRVDNPKLGKKILYLISPSAFHVNWGK